MSHRAHDRMSHSCQVSLTTLLLFCISDNTRHGSEHLVVTNWARCDLLTVLPHRTHSSNNSCTRDNALFKRLLMPAWCNFTVEWLEFSLFDCTEASRGSGRVDELICVNSAEFGLQITSLSSPAATCNIVAVGR